MRRYAGQSPWRALRILGHGVRDARPACEILGAIVEELRRSIRFCQRGQDYIHRVGEQGPGGALRDLSVRIGGEDGKQLDPLCRLERRGA